MTKLASWPIQASVKRRVDWNIASAMKIGPMANTMANFLDDFGDSKVEDVVDKNHACPELYRVEVILGAGCGAPNSDLKIGGGIN